MSINKKTNTAIADFKFHSNKLEFILKSLSVDISHSKVLEVWSQFNDYPNWQTAQALLLKKATLKENTTDDDFIYNIKSLSNNYTHTSAANNFKLYIDELLKSKGGACNFFLSLDDFSSVTKTIESSSNKKAEYIDFKEINSSGLLLEKFNNFNRDKNIMIFKNLPEVTKNPVVANVLISMLVEKKFDYFALTNINKEVVGKILYDNFIKEELFLDGTLSRFFENLAIEKTKKVKALTL